MKASTSEAVILVEYQVSHPIIFATNFTKRFKKKPSGAKRGMSILYIGATKSAIGTL
jgi:DNA-directed RNA polymerase subunit L